MNRALTRAEVEVAYQEAREFVRSMARATVKARLLLLGAVSDEMEWDWPGELLTVAGPLGIEFCDIGDLVVLNPAGEGRQMQRIGGRGRHLRFKELSRG